MIALLHHSIEKQAKERPDHAAFRCRDESISYQQLFQRSAQLANFLRSKGVQDMDRIGIFMGKSIELPVSVYGILSAGAAYVPIDPSAAKSRLEFIIKDCGIEILITSKAKLNLIKKVAEAGTTSLRSIIGIPENSLETIETIPWRTIEDEDPTPPELSTQEDDLAYIMYTSGSTGTPKGLMHTHRSGLAYAKYSTDLYGVVPTDRLGNHAPLHFDISTFEFLSGPFAGATSILIPEEELMFPNSLAQLIERERLSHWYSVPLALIQMLTRGDMESVDLFSLRYVLFGGEPFPPKYLIELKKLMPNAIFSNVYGPAEVNQCTYYHLPSEYSDSHTPIPIGSFWRGATGLVLDEDDRPLPANQPGELVVASSTMMHAYWGRADLNEKAFFIQEVVPGFHRKYYRTGDLVQQDENGMLHFLGRKDRQVKIRGYRLELDEVEAAFTSQLEIEEAVAIMTQNTEVEKEIVVAVIPRQDAEFNIVKAIEASRAKLPHTEFPTV